MAAKEESLVLKYLKKNPSSEALDISFGIDAEESVVKATLAQLLAKHQVAEKVSEQGVSTWMIATPPSGSTGSKVEKAPKAPKEPKEPGESSSGSGKGFVLLIALLTAIVSIGVSCMVGSSMMKKEEAAFDLKLKNTTESIGFFRIETNAKIDSLQRGLKKLQAPPPEAAPDAKATKAAKKPAKKKKK